MGDKFSKSTQYPGASWSASINLIETIKKNFNGSAVSYSDLASAYNVSSSTKSFTGKLSGAKQFGLIETSNGAVSLTNDGRKYLYPTSDNCRVELAYKCLKRPKLFSDLIDRYNGKPLPTKELLGNILMNEYQILQQVKDNVASIFLDSMEQCGFKVNGLLKFSLNEIENFNEEFPEQCEDFVAEKSTQSLLQHEAEKTIKITYPSLNGILAQIEFSKDATKEDLLGLRDMFDVVLIRQFNVDKNDL